jgi:hypothetical protein
MNEENQEIEQILQMLNENSLQYIFLSDEFKQNKQVAAFALELNGSLLMYMPFFQDDESLVQIALENDPKAFRYVSERLQQKENYYLPLIKKDASIFQELPEKLQTLENIYQIMKVQPGILFYLDKHWFKNNLFCLTLLEQYHVKQDWIIGNLPHISRKEFKRYEKLKGKTLKEFYQTKIFIETMLDNEEEDISSSTLSKI